MAEPRACAGCAAPFIPRKYSSGRQRFCTPKCAKRSKDRGYNQRHSAAHVERSRAWAKANPERNREHQRRSALRKKFGMTLEQYDAMLREQDDRCAICGTTDTSPWRWLTVDHDHETGAVRALLCQRCNSCLGQAGDDPARLRAAADYLERHR